MRSTPRSPQPQEHSRNTAPAHLQRIAAFLDKVTDELETVAEDLVNRAHAETGLPLNRLQNERTRMMGGVRIFAQIARESSWVSARIDRPDRERKPAPKPDLRSMLIPIGPVVVFGASNFPLAISVAGNDTWARSPPAAPSSPRRIPPTRARANWLPKPSLPRLRAKACRPGSFRCSTASRTKPAWRLSGIQQPGRSRSPARSVADWALSDAGASRPDPIPVYAEMGSINPVILLPGALAARADDIAATYVQSVTMGVGQFCTNPGIVLGLDHAALDRFSSPLHGTPASGHRRRCSMVGFVTRLYEGSIALPRLRV